MANDYELVRRILRGDREASERLIRDHLRQAFAIAFALTGSFADAEDLVQEAFLRALRNLSRLRGHQPFAPWLTGILRHTWADRRRKEARESRARKEWANERLSRTESRQVEDAMNREEARTVLQAAVHALPEHVRVPLVLYHIEGLDANRVAERLALRPATARKRIQRARDRLRKDVLEKLAPASAFLVPPSRLVRDILAAAPRPTPADSHAPSERPAATPTGPVATSSTSIPGGWPMKIALASIAGIVVVGSFALFVPTPSSSPESVPRDITKAPVEMPSQEPVAEPPSVPPESPRRDETPPPSPVTKPAVVGGTIRNEHEEPIPFADVYLVMKEPRETYIGESYLRADHFKRSLLKQTKADVEGRYTFRGLTVFGDTTLSPFKEGYAGKFKRVKIEEGLTRTDIDMTLAAGKTLVVRVLTGDGTPLTDAIVSIWQAWDRETILQGWGLGPTDEDGRCWLGLPEKAIACHVRVNSDRHGQDFFLETPITDQETELTLKDLARAEGSITWADGTPASGLTVRAFGMIPHPPTRIYHEGFMSFHIRDGLVRADGTYEVEGIQAYLKYRLFVIDKRLGARLARLHPLTPQLGMQFRPSPGDVQRWDYAIPKPITVRGQIRTEKSDAPVSYARVGVRRDGEALVDLFTEADTEGFFLVRLTAGSGRYSLHALPPGNAPAREEIRDLIADRFGVTLDLENGAQIEQDLTIFEPAVLPIRVLDHGGTPVRSIRMKLHVTFRNGAERIDGSSTSLDEDGRTAFRFYYPSTKIWYEIGAFPDGPTIETNKYPCGPGTVHPEETVILPRALDLRATLLDPTGKAHANRRVSLHVIYDDGSRAYLHAETTFTFLDRRHSARHVAQIRVVEDPVRSTIVVGQFGRHDVALGFDAGSVKGALAGKRFSMGVDAGRVLGHDLSFRLTGNVYKGSMKIDDVSHYVRVDFETPEFFFGLIRPKSRYRREARQDDSYRSLPGDVPLALLGLGCGRGI